MSKFSKPHNSVSNYFALALALVLAGVYPEIAFATPLDESQTVCANQTISIKWQGPNGRGDLITINDSSDHIGTEGHTSAPTSNGSPAVLKAPGEPGNYVKRYISWHSVRVLTLTLDIIDLLTRYSW